MFLPFSITSQSNENLIGIWHHFLNKDLFIILFTKWTAISNHSPTIHGFQRDDFKRSLRCGTRLSGQHSPKSCHSPASHMVVFGANRYQIFLRQRNLDPSFYNCNIIFCNINFKYFFQNLNNFQTPHIFSVPLELN